MKLPAKIVVVSVLPFFLTACWHKQKAQVQPVTAPIVDNPPPPPTTATVNLPSPELTIPTEPVKNVPTPPKAQPKHHRTRTNTPPPAAPTQDAANPAPNPAVSAIGTLSSGDPVIYRQQTEEQIASTERGLNGITRPLSDAEQNTAAQIRDFLKQARAALVSGDVDGAHTLAEKAKILLKELTE